MQEEIPKKAGLGPREPLSAEVIATAALTLVDKDGLDSFSFRRLAAVLGCQAMSIYHYFPSKAHLCEAMVDLCLAEIRYLPATRPWRERLTHLAHQIRGIALRHPGFFGFIATFRMNNRAGMAMLEETIRIFDDAGLGDAEAAYAFRSLSYYLMGAGLDEAMGYSKGGSAVEPVTEEEARRDFPRVARAGRYFGADNHAGIFETGLTALLDQIERLPKTGDGGG